MALEERRRYRYADGRLQKEFNGRNDDGWVKTKAEAYAVVGLNEFGEKRGPGRPKNVEEAVESDAS